ncbi:MAG: energy-coupling factor transporter transmembrane protein EcfT [Thermoleophilia bacterium]|nr:energy-coupling factor transporter transmembrane protein EcfT [Thermoleophilia bacterium]
MSAPVLHWPGRSWLHRAPVWAKGLALAVTSAALMAWGGPREGVAVAVGAVGAALSARVPARVFGRAMVPFAVTALVMWAWQMWMGEHRAAWVSGTRVLGLASLAVALTLTTPAAAVVRAVERGLGACRVRHDRVFRLGLTVGLTLRSVEHLALALARVRDARRARGLGRSVRALAVPTVVSAGRFAHGAGEALDARGLAHPDPPRARP